MKILLMGLIGILVVIINMLLLDSPYGLFTLLLGSILIAIISYV